jgi:hypothetical protein
LLVVGGGGGGVVDGGIEGDLDVGLGLGGRRVEDDDVDLFKVLEQRVQVGEVLPTARVVATLYTVRQ